MHKETAMSDQQRPRCPRCGNRLFHESDYLNNRFVYFWECSLGCSRQFDLDGKPLSRMVGERRSVAVPELVTVA